MQRSDAAASTGARRSAGTPTNDNAAAPSECCTAVCRSKTRQILGVDLRRWTLLGIIAILLILLISLVARLRGPQPHALPQVQVQGGLSVFFDLAVSAAPSYAAMFGRALAPAQCFQHWLGSLFTSAALLVEHPDEEEGFADSCAVLRVTICSVPCVAAGMPLCAQGRQAGLFLVVGYGHWASGGVLEGRRAPSCAAMHLVLVVQHAECKLLWTVQ